MRIPTLTGTIKRRILVNFRADPGVVRKILPNGFRPKLYAGNSVVGICLIRLEHLRPKNTPKMFGISSENAAHRISVEWETNGNRSEGVFIPRRDTDSALNSLVGGTLFPGEHNRADFEVKENGSGIDFLMRSRDGVVGVDLRGKLSSRLPLASCFRTLDDASEFFQAGSLGYSVTRANKTLDGIVLETKEWKVEPLDIESVSSTFYANTAAFPLGSIEFDHALIMRDVEHEWHTAPDYCVTD